MNEPDQYIRPEEASRLLKVTVRTLEIWETTGKLKCVRTKGGHRRFLRSDILSKIPSENQPPKKRFCYCRVSTFSQKEDLERQVKFFQLKYPDYEIIKDIGSGLNFNRKGLNTIINTAIQGNLQTLVVTHRDRLCRFGFDLISSIITNYSYGEIVVLDQQKTSPENELVSDLLSIITVFSSRLYGLRSHSLKNQIKQQATNTPKDSDSTPLSNSETTPGTTGDDTEVQVVL